MNQNMNYPMAAMHGSTYSAPLNYNRATETLGGYDTKVHPMTGQETPETNFAGGGLASLLESKGRRGDTMLVHMHPEEVRGLQALAMAHGGTLTINPETGLYEASFLKKLLPTIIGAALNTFAPGVGRAVGSMIPGLSEAAASTIGTGLVVGGAYGLIEGDLKKGLAAGLGAYSGANIAQSLQAAAVPAPVRPPAEEIAKTNAAMEAARNMVGSGTEAAQQSMPASFVSGGERALAATTPSVSDGLDYFTSKNKFVDNITPTAASLAAGRQAIARDMPGGGLGAGIKSLYTSPESRTAFGEALSGGFKSPYMQNISRAATYTGLMNALSPEPEKIPTGGNLTQNIVYIPGGYNPLYGTGYNQPFQLPGKYYKRTPQGLVPYDPYAMAPGGRAAGGEIKSYADGGVVNPNRDPGGNVLIDPRTQTPFSPYFTNPVTDPNVAATRAYIEDLNKRAKNPPVFAYPGGQGLGGTNEPYVPGPSTGGGGGGGDAGGGGSLTGNAAADLAVSMIGQHYINKGIDAGVDYLRDKFFPTEEQQLQRDAAEEQARRDAEAEQMQKDVAAEIQANPDIFGALPAAAGVASLVPPPAPAGTVTVEDVTVIDDPTAQAQLDAERGAMQQEIDARRTPSSSVNPSTIASVAPSVVSGVASLLPSTGGVALNAAGEVVVYGSKAANAAAAAAYSKAISAGADAATAAAAGEKAAAAAGGGLGKVIPGLQTALGLQQAYQGISKGNEAQAALGAAAAASGASQLLGIGALGGPLGMAAAAVIAAIGASLVNTKEFGDKALENYWKAVDAGRGIGQTPPDELAQGFINFYRTNKNNFAGQEKYGRTGNEDFVYDMTQVINNAVKEGKVGKDVDAATMYEQVVQPWLNSMGPGPQNEDARRIQDFMMTDLINSFMSGRPISHAQVKGDKKFKIVSEKPVYAGIPSAALQRGEMGGVYGQMPVGFEGRPDGLRGIGRDEFRTPFSEPQAAASSDVRRVQEILANTRSPIDAYREIFNPPAPTPFSESEERDYIPTPFSEEEEVPPPRKRAPKTGRAFNYGGAVGDDYNFGFAEGGMPGEYAAGGRLLDGPGDGMSDDIPAVIRGKGVQRAALADGEFVIPADVVSHLGNGSTKAGAKKLYDMMARVRQARTGKTRQAPAVKTDRLLPA